MKNIFIFLGIAVIVLVAAVYYKSPAEEALMALAPEGSATSALPSEGESASSTENVLDLGPVSLDAASANGSGGLTITKINPDGSEEVVGQEGETEKTMMKDITVGTGGAVTRGNTVTVNYVGTLDNGTKFDSSYDRGQTFSFTVGAGEVIKGWDQGLIGMKVGGKRQLVIPPSLGYGDRAVGPIPANSTLTFEIELVKID